MNIQSKINELESYNDLIKVGLNDLQKELNNIERIPQPKKKTKGLSNDTIARIKAMRNRNS